MTGMAHGGLEFILRAAWETAVGGWYSATGGDFNEEPGSEPCEHGFDPDDDSDPCPWCAEDEDGA